MKDILGGVTSRYPEADTKTILIEGERSINCYMSVQFDARLNCHYLMLEKY